MPSHLFSRTTRGDESFQKLLCLIYCSNNSEIGKKCASLVCTRAWSTAETRSAGLYSPGESLKIACISIITIFLAAKAQLNTCTCFSVCLCVCPSQNWISPFLFCLCPFLFRLCPFLFRPCPFLFRLCPFLYSPFCPFLPLYSPILYMPLKKLLHTFTRFISWAATETSSQGLFFMYIWYFVINFLCFETDKNCPGCCGCVWSEAEPCWVLV